MKRFFALFLSCILFVTFAASGCGSNQNATLQYTLSDEPVTLDPQVADDFNAKVVIEALFEGLTRLDAENQPYPGVAKSWESSNNDTRYTFYLREDAKWSDGTSVTANDFVFAFRRAVDPQTNSATCDALYCIQNARAIHEGKLSVTSLGVSAPDDHTLVVELEYSKEDFPALVATTPFMPCKESYFTGTEGKYGLDSNCILGNGPFEMENRYSWEHNSYINLIRSDTYTGETAVSPAALTFTISSEAASKPSALLENNQTDAALLSQTELNAITSANLHITAYTDITWGICFNTQSDKMKKQSVRKLYLQCLDREQLLQEIPEGTTTANDIITPSTTFNGMNYRESVGSGFYLKPNLEAVENADTKDLPSITILCLNDESSKQIANAILTMWNKNLGHYFNMEPLSQQELEARIAAGNYDIAITSIQPAAEGPVSLLSLFQSDSKNNPAHLNSTTYDTILEKTTASTPQEVLDACKQAEQYLNDNAIFYPLYYETRYYVTPENVSDVVFHPYELGIDFIHAKKD